MRHQTNAIIQKDTNGHSADLSKAQRNRRISDREKWVTAILGCVLFWGLSVGESQLAQKTQEDQVREKSGFEVDDAHWRQLSSFVLFLFSLVLLKRI